MRAGELDRRIVIQQPTETRDDYGENGSTWTTFASPWAKVIPTRGGEGQQGDRVNAQIDVVFRIRWLSGVTRKMRILYESQYYDIQYTAEIGRREALEITAHVHQTT